MSHPFGPQFDIIAKTLPYGLGDKDDFWETVSSQAETEQHLDRQSLDPYGSSREALVAPQPHEIRTPSGTFKYPKSRQYSLIQSGVNSGIAVEGFLAQSLFCQCLGTNQFLFCRELGIYVSAGATFVAQFNFPFGLQTLNFEWHTAAFNTTPPAVVAGQWAAIWVYDEWIV
jgi:hypothetical protein